MYGEPTDKPSAGEVRWRQDDTKVKVVCTDDKCHIHVEDSTFENSERLEQLRVDAEQRHKDAPEAPAL